MRLNKNTILAGKNSEKIRKNAAGGIKAGPMNQEPGGFGGYVAGEVRLRGRRCFVLTLWEAGDLGRGRWSWRGE